MSEAPGFVAIYRWRIEPKNVAAFRDRWLRETERLKAKGGMGSLLAVADDGTYHAIALWPDRETRRQAFDQSESAEPWPPAERLETTMLTPLDNLWGG
ncbi:hypothetical protein GRI38_02880 [Altererythrobacter aurantiacus]|uniref:Antibiotic biosynthesis monooxygenase n=1 Tax=Parapontixanthobacter aurantiacus TaxID=1463599 RepID=A0A844ZBT0_9SPHN|nr:hypothetical protein [Parapontixanthobacter aurantiacus]MXO84974.1 hypothetical protein [Parapontixanthobacter aurantiacus]